MTGLDDAYGLDTVDDARRLYRDWAATYDSEFVDLNGYVYGRRVAETMVEHFDNSGGKEAPVVCDVGCGTGIVGVELTTRGEWIIDGLDLSIEMLDVAANKVDGNGLAVYRNLIQVDLTEVSDLATESYDCVVSSGLFTYGHLGPEVVPAIVDLTRRGGLVVLGVNREFYAQAGFGQMFESLSQEREISDLAMIDIEIYTDAPEGHEGSLASVVIFNRL